MKKAYGNKKKDDVINKVFGKEEYIRYANKLITNYKLNKEIKDLFQAALIYHKLDELNKAKILYEEIIKSGKNKFIYDSINNLALIYNANGEQDKAIKMYKTAIKFDENNGLAYYNLGVLYQKIKNNEEALINFKIAEKFNYNKSELYLNIGNLYLIKDASISIEYYNKAIKVNPDNFLIYYNRGIAWQMKMEYNNAISDYRKTIELNKDFINAYLNLGVSLKGIKKVDEAINIYKKGLNINPKDYLLNYNLGAEYKEIQNYSLAIKHTQLAIDVDSNSYEAYSNLGNIYLELKNMNMAFESYSKGLSINGNYDVLWYNYGRALQTLSQHHESIKYYEMAVKLNNKNNRAKLNLATCYENILQHDIAFNILNNLIREYPEFKEAYGNLLFLINYHPNLSQQEIKQYYQFVNTKLYENKKINQKKFKNRINRKIKVGFVSADFNKSSVSNFTKNIFEGIDKSEFTLYAYVENKIEDDTTVDLKKNFSSWKKINGLTTNEVVETIENDEVDILFDLSGHTSNNRLEVFAYRPALVSITWLGYGYTTGLRAIDYYIAGPDSIEEESEIFFSEKIWRFKTAQALYSADQNSGEVGPLPFESNGFITFGCLSRSVRLNNKLLETWGLILLRTPQSRLILNSRDFQDNILKTKIHNFFSDLGIDNSRVSIGYDTPPWNIYRQIDVMLDCFPHNSGTTLMESLYMGIPFITLKNRPTVGTIGTSILSVINKKLWIANNPEEYINIAIKFNSDITNLSLERKTLRALLTSSALMNSRELISELQISLKSMFDINFQKQNYLS